MELASDNWSCLDTGALWTHLWTCRHPVGRVETQLDVFGRNFRSHDMYYNEFARLLQCVHYVTNRSAPAKTNKPDAQYSFAVPAARPPDASLIK